EEIEFSEHESDEEESEQEEQPESQSEGGESESEDERIEPRVSKKKTVSPWDFTKYSESVAEEHARRSTTSVDDKIYAVRQRSAPVVPLPDSDDDSSSDAEADKQ
ncbi:DEAD-box ATP-dependent RNA helicase 28-like, partial [Trifolium medium]|nr:DEAD-box ATP-dependent RNA helicase 28-like [Trifolium medium]